MIINIQTIIYLEIIRIIIKRLLNKETTVYGPVVKLLHSPRNEERRRKYKTSNKLVIQHVLAHTGMYSLPLLQSTYIDRWELWKAIHAGPWPTQ